MASNEEQEKAFNEAVAKIRADLEQFKKRLNISDKEFKRSEIFYHQFAAAISRFNPHFFNTPLAKKSFIAGFVICERSRRLNEETLLQVADDAINGWKNEAGNHCARSCCDVNCECDGTAQTKSIRLRFEKVKEQLGLVEPNENETETEKKGE